MIRECIGVGRTVEEAIDKACHELGCERGNVDFEIIDLAKKTFFGMKFNPARVRVTFEDGIPEPKAQRPAAPQKPAQKPAVAQKPAQKIAEPAKPTVILTPTQPAPEETKTGEKPPRYVYLSEEEADRSETTVLTGQIKEKSEMAVEYITDILHGMGLKDFTTACKLRDGTLIIAITGDDLGAVIGRRGETLDSIQYLTGLVCNKGDGEYLRLSLDSGNYREKRVKTLEDLAYKVARTAVRTGRGTTLEPMNPYDRRIIHSAVSRVDGASSTSIGEEPNRRIIINAANSRRALEPATLGSGTPARFNRGGFNRSGGYSHSRRQYDDRRPKSTEAAAKLAESTAAKSVEFSNDIADKPLYGKINLD